MEILVSEVSRSWAQSGRDRSPLPHRAGGALECAQTRPLAHSIQVSLDVEREHVRLETSDPGDGVMGTRRESPGLGLRTHGSTVPR